MPESTVNVVQEHPDRGVDGLANPSGHTAHSTFYLSGQTVVFSVENTLFKVDPALFTNGEDSTLKTMLSLPQGDNPDSREGSSNETPIFLQGDTSTQFETLLWGLYTQKLCQAHVSKNDTDRYIQLAKISHKYDLRSLEAWATSGLFRLAQTGTSVRKAYAASLLETFYLYNCTEAANLMLETVKKMMLTGTCSIADITAFINIGQKYSLPGLTSRGYYAAMLRPRNEWESEVTFSRTDRRRLLNGHYALSDHSLDGSIESLTAKFGAHHLSWGTAFSTYAVPSKEEDIRKLHSLKSVDVIERLRQIVEAFLKDTPVDRRQTHVEDTHVEVFRADLKCVVDDLFESKFPLYFVDV